MKNIKKLLTVLFAILMCVSLTACGETQTETETDEVTYKDTFTYAIGGEPSSLDPGNAGDAVTAYVTNQTIYGLYHIGEDGSMVADSVEEIEESEDGLTYTIKLKENYWSDGQKVVAEDFVNGVKHTLSLSESDAGYKYFIYDWIVGADEFKDGGATADMTDIGVVALDEDTIQYTLKADCPYFISLLSCSVFAPIRAEYAVDGDITWANNPEVPTNGAYKYVSVDKATEIVMEKNEYFCNADQVTTQTLVCKNVEDMDAQLMQFQNGEIDFATSVDATVVTKLFDDDEMQISGAINYYVSFNCYGDNEALQNKDVRRALQLGVDRQLICDAMDSGDVYYPIYSFIPDGLPGVNGDWNDEAGQYVYCDYEEAKELLAKAGYDTPDEDGYVLTLEYSYNASTMHTTVADVLTSEYAKIGVKIVQKTAELRTFFSDRTNGDYELARNAFSADYMDVTSFLGLFLKTVQTVQTMGDDTYDEMYYAANALQGDDRLNAFHDAEKYFIEEMSYTNPLFGYGSVALVKKGTENYPSSPQANNYFWYVKVPA